MAVFEVIDESTLDATAQNITMSSIPDTYDHLYLTGSIREGGSSLYAELEFRFNDDSSPYSNTQLKGNAGSPYSDRATSDACGDVIGQCAAGGMEDDVFSVVTMWIPHYTSSNGKQVIIQSAGPNQTTSDDEWFLRMTAGLWNDSATINKFRMQAAGGPELQVGTTLVLYGVNGVS